MDNMQGYSLIEVLISLMLVTLLALCLLDQQLKSVAYVHSLSLRARASGFLDKVNEYLYLKCEDLPKAPNPYQFDIQYEQSYWILQIQWLHSSGFLSRQIWMSDSSL